MYIYIYIYIDTTKAHRGDAPRSALPAEGHEARIQIYIYIYIYVYIKQANITISALEHITVLNITD